jgi:hypothetical protein
MAARGDGKRVRLEVLWALVTADGRNRYYGELWTHPIGVEARVIQDNQPLTAIAFQRVDEAMRFLEAERVWLTGSLTRRRSTDGR